MNRSLQLLCDGTGFGWASMRSRSLRAPAECAYRKAHGGSCSCSLCSVALTAVGRSAQVDLVGHSAGGWLARAFVGDAKYFDGGTIKTTVTIS